VGNKYVGKAQTESIEVETEASSIKLLLNSREFI
jgi:hypothetical protein